jgi:hypothetical protein
MKHQCGCNQQGERARIRAVDGQASTEGLLVLPNENSDGLFWPDELAGISDQIRTPMTREVTAEVLSAVPHTHYLSGWFFHPAQQLESKHEGPHFHFESHVAL